MGRRLDLGNKKLRGVSRRLRALKEWAASFEDIFPRLTDRDYADGYWNCKIPVAWSLAEGPHTTPEIQAICVQAMIDAAYHLAQAKPAHMNDIRVTCLLSLPSLFASELCVYTQEDYYRWHIGEQPWPSVHKSPIKDKSLCKEWNLSLPSLFSEYGMLVTTEIEDEGERSTYIREDWLIGEI